MPKGVNKGVRALAKQAGCSPALVTRKKAQGKSDAEIIAEANKREPAVTTRKGRESYADAQARKEVALANLRELEEKQKRGELIEAATVEEKWLEIGVKFRDALMGLRSRVCNRLPDEWRREVTLVVDEEARQILKALSDEIRADQTG